MLPPAPRFLLIVWLFSLSASAAEAGRPLPRFASLAADKVNVRTGPGVRYPVDWVFVHRDMPVEIVAEYDNWRKVRDWQGTEGWVHRAMLSGQRTVVVRGGTRPLRRNPSVEAPMVARVGERVIGRVLECNADWCRLDVSDIRGWMRRTHFWGIYDTEKIE